MQVPAAELEKRDGALYGVRKFAIAHVDDTGAHKDQRVRIGSLDVREMGRHLVRPTVPGADRTSIVQGNTGAYQAAGVKLIGGNHFVGIMDQKGHRAPIDTSEWFKEIDKHQGYISGVMRRRPGIYQRVTTREDLDRPGIKVLTTVEELPVELGNVSLIETVEGLKKRGVVQIGPWNNPTIAAPHSLEGNDDYGVKKQAEGFFEGVLEAGIAVDLSHSSRKFQMRMLNMAEKVGGTVLISHTGNPDVPITRNVKRDIISEVGRRGSIVALAYGKNMLGGNRMEHIVRGHEVIAETAGIDHVAHGFDSNGMALGTQNLDVPTVLEIGKIGDSLREAGWKPQDVEGIDRMNYHHYGRRNLPPAQRAA
jgi:microsomal dipeptidase-like Zn-dependent dipeptidase